MIFATFALGFFCPRHACEERDCGGRCSNETISLRCADTEVIRLVLLQTADDITGVVVHARHIISSAWIVAVLRWVVAPRDKGWPCAQPIEDDALAQLRKDAGGYGAGGTMLVTLRDSNAI